MDRKAIFILLSVILLLSIFIINSVDAESEQTAASNSTEDKAKQSLMYGQRAEDDYAKGNYNSAIENFNKCIELNDWWFRVTCMSRKAQMLCDPVVKRYGEGISIYNQLIKEKEDKGINDLELKVTYYLRGVCFYMADQNISALSDYEKACFGCDKETQPYACKLYCQKAFDLKHEIKRGIEWVFVGNVGKSDYYYQKTSILRLSDDYIKAWVRQEPSFDNDKDKFFYGLDLEHFDCTKREMAIESRVTYDYMNVVMTSNNFDTDMTKQPIIPGSIGEDLYNAICTKYAKGQEKKK